LLELSNYSLRFQEFDFFDLPKTVLSFTELYADADLSAGSVGTVALVSIRFSIVTF